MKYFIDFEMLAPDYRVGQIGCVNTKGEEFSVHISYNDSEIAKIVRDILKDVVMSPDDAFSALFDWIYQKENGKPEIYCWGSNDVEYVRATMNYMTHPKAKMMALYLYHNLTDYHLQFLSKYGRKNNMKLEHAAKLLDPTIKQAHIAIEDAKLLRMVYLVSDTLPVYNQIVNVVTGKVEKRPTITLKKNYDYSHKVIAMKDQQTVAVFPSIDAAADWIIENRYTSRDKTLVVGNITHAIKSHTNTYKLKWVLQY